MFLTVIIVANFLNMQCYGTHWDGKDFGEEHITPQIFFLKFPDFHCSLSIY
jgi:hypothetical protein